MYARRCDSNRAARFFRDGRVSILLIGRAANPNCLALEPRECQVAR
jgi:hypothetical protein